MLYAFTQANCFFACMSEDPALESSLTWLEYQLASSAARMATWRIVYCHYPVYSAALAHPNSGYPAFEALCDKYAVTIVFTGHVHNYERTFLLKNQSVVTTANTVRANQGTVYVVSGGGGAPLHATGTDWWTSNTASIYQYCVVDVTVDKLQFKMKNRNRKVSDTFTILHNNTR